MTPPQELHLAIHPLGPTPGIQPFRFARLVRTERCEMRVHKQRNRYRKGITLLLALCVSIAGCQPQASNNDGVPVDIIGIDHLADHLSVQEFTVDGAGGFQAGKGGRHVCCATLPHQWRPGMTVTVRWSVTNWRDCTGEEHEAIVPVERYDEVGNLWVHFLADGRVRVVSSNYGAAAANVPGSLHPVKDPIPDKHPWDIWDLDNDCRPYDKDHPKKWTLP